MNIDADNNNERPQQRRVSTTTTSAYIRCESPPKGNGSKPLSPHGRDTPENVADRIWVPVATAYLIFLLQSPEISVGCNSRLTNLHGS